MENFRPVVGFEEQYEVSDAGHVYGVARVAIHSNGFRQRIARAERKIVMSNRNRATVNLCRDGRYTMKQVHHMVLEAFVGPCPVEGWYGCHRDDDPTNNALDNLYWGTPSENTEDCLRNGNHSMARKTHCHKGHEFTEENTKVSTRSTGRTKRECRACLQHFNESRRVQRAAKTHEEGDRFHV